MDIDQAEFDRSTLQYAAAAGAPPLATAAVFTLRFTAEQVNVLSAGLGKLPLELSLGVFDDLRRQVQAQQTDAC